MRTCLVALSMFFLMAPALAEGAVCDDLIDAAFGLCNAYCEAEDCDVQEPGRESCERLRWNFEKHTGTPIFPCDAPFCGDGTVDAGEDCDSPFGFCRGGCNPLLGICVDITCSEDCSCPEPFCGDTIVDSGEGEECDDGNNVDGDACSGDCLLEGALCGGFDGIPCQPGEFCQFAPNTCGVLDLFGVCTQVPSTCIWDCRYTVFDPVCGCDGNTYNNDCARRCGGTSLAHQGACVAGEQCGWAVCPPDQFCGNPLRVICTQPGQVCVQ